MSKIGKQIITIPNGINITLNGNELTVKGKLGELKKIIDLKTIDVKIENNTIVFSPKRNDKRAKSLWGTYASHIKNMIKGVETPFEKTLIVEGVGYKWEVNGNQLKLALGFSHPVIIPIPTGLKVEIDKLTMKISGIDKEKVGGFAKDIRSLKEPEPYKGKGIRYSDEVIRRKQGKRSS